MPETLHPDIRHFIASIPETQYHPDEALPFPVRNKTFRKNQVITRYGQIERYAYFLKSGMVKISMRVEKPAPKSTKGKSKKKESVIIERILEFFFPGSFFSAYTSFLTGEASDVEVVALTDCEVEVLEVNEMKASYKHSLIANQLRADRAEYYYKHKTRREKEFLTLSPKVRYYQLFHSRPEMVQKLSVTQLANYLGVARQTLSRIRSEGE
ncbi:MAG: Crp/Fnr family transcriptional regulator [Chitinophagaceae bacterium]|nr:Crp/Fnr family transcriptional regulator [Chitinophagaceae bacterium]